MFTILKSLIALLSQIDWSSLAGMIGNKKAKPEVAQPKAEPAVKEKQYVEVISFQDYITASGKYNERLTHKELDDEKVQNAYKLLEKVNVLLNDLGVYQVAVSSGFRPSDINAGIVGAAKKSLHMSCLAIDIADLDGKLDKLIASRDDLLKKYGLWLENPKKTINWCHLDCKDRGKRDLNIFMP